MTDQSPFVARPGRRISPDLLVASLLIVLAAAARLYQLGTFPYFPVSPPWLGSSTNPGLYVDEAGRLGEIARFPGSLTTYQPSLQIPLVKLSQFLLGQSNLADRLPSALESVITAVLVFYVAKLLYEERGAAIASSLYFIAMAPALIYGRMLFYDNLVGIFLVLTIACLVKSQSGGDSRWLYLGAIASALTVVAKVDGLFVPLFFTAWTLASRRGTRLKPLLLTWLPLAAGALFILSLAGSLAGFLDQWGLALVGREPSFELMLVQSLPSAYAVTAEGFFRPEFWYLFSYICLGVMLAKGSRWGVLLASVFVTFLVLDESAWGIGSYYVISLFPAMALAVGGALKPLLRLGTAGSVVLYGALYVPLVVSFVYSITPALFVRNYPLFLFKEALFGAPLLGWAAGYAVTRSNPDSRMPLSGWVLVCFLGLLVLGTPWLYSYYFLGRPF